MGTLPLSVNDEAAILGLPAISDEKLEGIMGDQLRPRDGVG
jgi:hypothetical protein